MKKVILILLVFIAFNAFGQTLTKVTVESHNYELSVPENWKTQKISNSESLSLIASRPKEGKERPVENIVVKHIQHNENKSLDDAFLAYKSKLKSQHSSNFKIDYENDICHYGKAYKKIIITYNSPSTKAPTLKYIFFTMVNNTSFILTMRTTPSNFKNYLKLYDKIMSSLIITSNDAPNAPAQSSFENLIEELKALKDINDLPIIEKKHPEHLISKHSKVLSGNLSKQDLKISSLQEGEFIESESGNSFIKVFKKTKVECAKIKAINLLDKSDEGKKLAIEIVNKLKNGEDFSILAKQYSKDTFYAKKGGELGWIKRGEFTKEAENIIFPLKKGETTSFNSDQFGWTIILKTENNQQLPLIEFVATFK